jgi:flagellar basal body-associated protein FliL
LADEKQRFIRVSMSLEYSLDDKLDEIESRIPQIKDAILTFIPTKTSDELKMVDGKKNLRENLITQLNSFFNEKLITNIYFTEFVIQ